MEPTNYTSVSFEELMERVIDLEIEKIAQKIKFEALLGLVLTVSDIDMEKYNKLVDFRANEVFRNLENVKFSDVDKVDYHLVRSIEDKLKL